MMKDLLKNEYIMRMPFLVTGNEHELPDPQLELNRNLKETQSMKTND